MLIHDQQLITRLLIMLNICSEISPILFFSFLILIILIFFDVVVYSFINYVQYLDSGISSILFFIINYINIFLQLLLFT